MMILADLVNSEARFKSLDLKIEEGYPDANDDDALKRPVPSFSDMKTSDNDHPAKKMCCQSSIRIPCKARLMTKSHNSGNAFFEIPSGAPHGLLLSCSHLECAGSSARGFRFCQVCAVPVAKRNFLKRHGHGLIGSSTQLKTIDNASELVARKSGLDLVSSPMTCSVSREGGTSTIDDFGEDAQSGRYTSNHRRLHAHEQAWLDLLVQRPKVESIAGMKEWVDKVMLISSKQPIYVSDTVLPTSFPVKQVVNIFLKNSRTPTDFDGWCSATEENEELPWKKANGSCTEIGDMPPFNMRQSASTYNFFSVMELERDDFRTDSSPATNHLKVHDTKQRQERAETRASDSRVADFNAFMDCVDVGTVFV